MYTYSVRDPYTSRTVGHVTVATPTDRAARMAARREITYAGTWPFIPVTLVEPSVRTVDVSEWADFERPASPVSLTAAPYGETLYREFQTVSDALEFARDLIRTCAGKSYGTSWGDQSCNLEVTISEYVTVTADPETGTPVTAELDPVDPAVIATLDTPAGPVTVWERTDGSVAATYESGVAARSLPSVDIAYLYGSAGSRVHTSIRSGRDAVEFITDSWMHGRRIVDVTAR